MPHSHASTHRARSGNAESLCLKFWCTLPKHSWKIMPMCTAIRNKIECSSSLNVANTGIWCLPVWSVKTLIGNDRLFQCISFRRIRWWPRQHCYLPIHYPFLLPLTWTEHQLRLEGQDAWSQGFSRDYCELEILPGSVVVPTRGPQRCRRIWGFHENAGEMLVLSVWGPGEVSAPCAMGQSFQWRIFLPETENASL